MKLRPYQHDAIDAVFDTFKSKNAALVVMPTGTGKTICFASAIERMQDKGHASGRCMVLAHREELIRQAVDKIEKVTGYKADIEMANNWATEDALTKRANVVVSSIQTQVAGKNGGRMSRFDPADFALVIIDEAHHAPAKSYRKVIDYYRKNPKLKILGVTATPDRADEAALGQIFDEVAYVYEIAQAIEDGYLVPIKQRLVVVNGLDFSKIKTTAGDLNGKQLAAVMEAERALHEIATPTIELVGSRKALVFCASVAHAELLCEIFNRHRQNCAKWVCGTTEKEKRRQTLRDYTAGRFQYLCNVGVFTEGFDEPSIECVVMARPTKSRALFTQMIGRGTRPLTGVVDDIEEGDLFDGDLATPDQARREAIAQSAKPFVEIIDFVGNCGHHKLVHTTDILGGNYSDKVINRAAKRATKAGAPTDVLAGLELAKREIDKEAERKRNRKIEQRKQVIGQATYTTRLNDPFSVLDIQPHRERGWEKGRPLSDRQLAFLKRNKIDAARMSYSNAGQLIGEIIRRQTRGECTHGQAKLLQRYDYETHGMTQKNASDLINILQQNKWKKPVLESQVVF